MYCTPYLAGERDYRPLNAAQALLFTSRRICISIIDGGEGIFCCEGLKPIFRALAGLRAKKPQLPEWDTSYTKISTFKRPNMI